MKTYITHDDFINDLVEKKDNNVDKVIKSYKSAVLTNTLMSLALWLEVVTMVYLQLDEMSDKTIVIFIIALATTSILGAVISRFIAGKEYYRYIKNNQIIILEDKIE